ncbi:MAG: NTP transferase domain-containing protein [Candidatus Poseidoniaceae archaeon]|nr:NTP transferase domain-containing protein [Candidatus Poseidoniaceae archaeon]
MAKGIPAIILAAGASSRLGQPKALVNVGDTNLLGLAFRRLQNAGCSPIVVVTSSELAYDCLTSVPGATIVINKAPQEGRTGSIQCGLMSLCGDHGRTPRMVLIAPVDRPGWNVNLVKQLMKSKNSCKPVSNNRSGHPVIIAGDDIEDVLAANPDESLRELVSFNPVQVNYQLISLNIDTEQDLQLLLDNEQTLLQID